MSRKLALLSNTWPEAGQTRRSERWYEFATLLTVFLLTLGVYRSSNGEVPMTDMVWTVPMALSLLHEGNLDLDEFPYAHGDGRLRYVNGHWQSYFPSSSSVLVAPVVALVEYAMDTGTSPGLYAHLKSTQDWDLVAKLNQGIASLFAALTAVVIYLTSRFELNRPKALFLTLAVAFGTPLWSTASRDLWQHTTSVFAVAWVLYFLVRAQNGSRWALFWSGLAAGVAYVTRPTTSLLALGATLYVAIEHRRHLLYFLAGAAVIAVPFLITNWAIYESLLPPYFRVSRIANNPDFWEATAGNLISPGRGLFVYSPLLLFGFYGFALNLRRRPIPRLDVVLASVVVLHWLVISSFKHWSGGASYGPRFWTELVPVFAYFLIPVVDQVTRQSFWTNWPRRLLGALFFASIAWSVFVHYRGSTQFLAWHWNGSYLKVVDSVDEDPSRIWDWSDPQFLRGLRPASLAVEPTELCLVAREGDTLLTNLTLLNRGDKPYRWTMKTPPRVFQQAAYDRVPGLGYGEPQLSFDTSQLSVGDHALGGLYIAAYTEDGQPGKNSPLIMPVALRVLPADAQVTEMGTGEPVDCVATPPDIAIHDENRPAASSQLQAVFGPEWYDRETQGEMSWRWTASPAQIFVFAPKRKPVRLSSTPIALRDETAPNGFGERGIMRIHTDDQMDLEVPVQVGQPFGADLSLHAGWNVVTLELQAGNVRPIDIDPSTGDSRLLSFALGPIVLSSQQR